MQEGWEGLDNGESEPKLVAVAAVSRGLPAM